MDLLSHRQEPVADNTNQMLQLMMLMKQQRTATLLQLPAPQSIPVLPQPVERPALTYSPQAAGDGSHSGRTIHANAEHTQQVRLHPQSHDKTPRPPKATREAGEGGHQEDWTFSDIKNSKEAHKAISRENARQMIDTSNMLRKDRIEAYQSGRLSVHMEDHHKHLENRKGHYEAGFIINEILGPRPETPLLDDIATQE